MKSIAPSQCLGSVRLDGAWERLGSILGSVAALMVLARKRPHARGRPCLGRFSAAMGDVYRPSSSDRSILRGAGCRLRLRLHATGLYSAYSMLSHLACGCGEDFGEPQSDDDGDGESKDVLHTTGPRQAAAGRKTFRFLSHSQDGHEAIGMGQLIRQPLGNMRKAAIPNDLDRPLAVYQEEGRNMENLKGSVALGHMPDTRKDYPHAKAVSHVDGVL